MRHLSLFGSALPPSLRDVADVDLHLVIPRMDRSAFASLSAAAEATVQGLADRVGRPWRVELRHGPFKPQPEDARVLQLHLLIDDEASLARLPCALLLHRAMTGLLLAGEPLPADRGSPTLWLQEARMEMTKWRDALAADEIAFRHWVFDPEPHLAENRIRAETPWDLRCLLKGAAAASDLCYRATTLAAPRTEGAAADLALPLLSQLGEQPAWQDLAGSWERLRQRAITVLERRLDHLCGEDFARSPTDSRTG